MGNILYCCRKVSEYITTKGPADQTEEHSALLSQENSDGESVSPLRTSADLLDSPVLDQDHLLFPDIVLSSNLHIRGDSTEPLELLLATSGQDASKEDGFDESNLRNGGERNRGLVRPPSTNIIGTNQLRSIEDEWPLLSSLYQVPAAQNRICTHGLEADTCKDVLAHGTDIFSPVNISVLVASSLDVSKCDIDISQREDGWIQTEQYNEPKNPKEQLHTEKKQDKKKLNESGPNSAAQAHLDAIKMQKPAHGIPVEWPLLQKKQREAQTLKAQPDEKLDFKKDAQTSEILEMQIIKREHANEKKTFPVEEPDIADMSSGLKEQEFGEMKQSLSQMDQGFVWNNEVEQTQWDLEVLKQSTGISLQHSEQTTLAVTQVEGKEDKTERFTLFVVDKLFLATPNFTGVYSQLNNI